MESKYNIIIDVNLNNEFIRNLREIDTPDNIKNKIIFIYQARYDKNNMYFLEAIDSNKLGISLANYLSNNDLSKLSTTEETFPTINNNIKLILIPAPNIFSLSTGVWELFISNNDVSDYKQLLFNSKRLLFLYYTNEVDFTIYNNNYINYYHFGNINNGIGNSTFTKLDDPEMYSVLN